MIKASEAHEKSVLHNKLNKYLNDIESMINKAIERGEFKIVYNTDLSPMDGFVDVLVCYLRDNEYIVKDNSSTLTISW